MFRRFVFMMYLALPLLLGGLTLTARDASLEQVPGNTPLVVDFGGARDDAPVAGLDQWLTRNSDGHAIPAADITGPQRVMVLRVYFADYSNTSRYTQAEVQGFFVQLDQLWQDTSYGNISIDSQVSSLFQLPDNRSDYIDDLATGDLSNDGKFDKVLNDAIDNSPTDEGLDWSNLDAIMVVMAETDMAQFHRGQGTGSRNLKQGPGGETKNVGAAIFSENPSENDLQVWGRWAHEIGHAFQQGGPAHPSNYRSEFELMDSNYPGQTGVFEKQEHTGFPGWLPPTKYQVITPDTGGDSAFIWAMEYPPGDLPDVQAVKAEITEDLYYLISVRRQVLGDDLNGDFSPTGIPSEGVLIERVVEGADPWVEVKAPPTGTRNDLWEEGMAYDGGADGIIIEVGQQVDSLDDFRPVRVLYDDAAFQPDVALHPWTSPPGNTWETTDIWIDSPVNSYDNYGTGMWNDLTGNLVPIGNGDVPAIGQVNRLYARVRNIGTSTATDVVVRWEITDPPGVGIAGAEGWASIGSVDKNDFPGLASIAPDEFVDVYTIWTPDFPIPEEDLEGGLFQFHTCVRVILDPVAGETVLGNQDGEREQENISTFQAVEADAGAPMNTVIRLYNDDLVNPKFFTLSFENDLPDGWLLDINGGVLGMELGPGEVREIPVTIEPVGLAALGSVFGVDIKASSLRLLENDLDPNDKHPEFDDLGGARVEVRVLRRPDVSAQVAQTPDGIFVTGMLEVDDFNQFYDPNNPLRVMIVGVDSNREFLPTTANVLTVNPDGKFEGLLPTDTGVNPNEVVCLFANTTKLASASCGFVSVKPTAIELISFTGEAGGDQITLAWETASEIDNEGFNIWRSMAVEGPYTKVNPTLIPAQGNADTGASYRYVDTNVVKGKTYYYKLEDIDTFAGSTFHGPISAATEIRRIYLPIIVK